MGKSAGSGVGCSKQNGSRNRAHAAYYSSLPPKIAAKKDRHVLKSSHGKYSSVAELVAVQRKAEK